MNKRGEECQHSRTDKECNYYILCILGRHRKTKTNELFSVGKCILACLLEIKPQKLHKSIFFPLCLISRCIMEHPLKIFMQSQPQLRWAQRVTSAPHTPATGPRPRNQYLVKKNMYVRQYPTQEYKGICT